MAASLSCAEIGTAQPQFVLTEVSLLSDISAQKENGFADVVVDNNKLVPGCSLNNHHCDENYFQLRRFLSGTEVKKIFVLEAKHILLEVVMGMK